MVVHLLMSFQPALHVLIELLAQVHQVTLACHVARCALLYRCHSLPERLYRRLVLCTDDPDLGTQIVDCSKHAQIATQRRRRCHQERHQPDPQRHLPAGHDPVLVLRTAHTIPPGHRL